MPRVSKAGLTLYIEGNPDNLPKSDATTSTANKGEIHLHAANVTRLDIYVDYGSISSSTPSYATVKQSHVAQMIVPRRPNKYTSAPARTTHSIGEWFPEQYAGTSTITADFDLSSAVTTSLGNLSPQCDVRAT